MNDNLTADAEKVSFQHRNKIVQLEEMLGASVEISTDQFNYFNNSVGLKVLIQNHKIVALNIFRAKISDFNIITQNFPDLTHLEIFESEFHSIPPEIVKLSNLQDLDFRYNHIRIVPDFICQLTSLRIIQLSDNEITTLPDNIGTLPHLERLSLERNQITLLPPSLSQCTSLRKIYLSSNPLVSLAGIPSSCDFPDIGLDAATELLTFKGCVLAQFYAIECAMQNDYADLKRVERGNFQFSYHGPLTELPLAQVPRFVEELLGSQFVSFPYLPLPDLRSPNNPWQLGKILPEFLTFLTAILEHIADYTIDSWRAYYARHPIDLAHVYITDQALSEDDFARLVHECDYRLYTFLKDHLASIDPLLQALHPKFSIELGTLPLFL